MGSEMCIRDRAKTPPYALPRKGGVGAKGGIGFGTIPDLNWTAAVYVALAHLNL